jgi:type II secretory pathway pseudopilin PulG
MTMVLMRHRTDWRRLRPAGRQAFSFPDFLVVLAVFAVLAAVVVPMVTRSHATAKKTQCINNLRQVTRAVLMYAEEQKGRFPLLSATSPNSTWWWYKEMVKGYTGLKGPSSPRDKVFACPNDRGYDEAGPFCLSAKFDYQSYVFNGVNLRGVPNVAGRTAGSIRTPAKTLLMMEWTAHAPLSWHNSKTGEKNHPFYNDAESVVGFVDGQVKYVRIYYDGVNPAYTRDPIPGYDYRFSGD